MTDLVLIGDSMIDNGPYVVPGEPDVAAQVSALMPGVQVEMRAVDGSRLDDVARALDARPVPEGARVFMTAGGNDALQQIDLLTDPARLTFAEAMVKLKGIATRFRGQYAAVLDRLAPASEVMVGTIYDPAFEGAEAALIPAASGALTAFNDAIQAEAVARAMAVLEMRRVICTPEACANPIEPSAVGGAQIAAAVAAWALA
ncbi:MAG: SGNH/GDSL hydrolase family protein [Pseudomonadota bacterium]